MTKPTTQTIGSVLSDIYDAWRAHNLDLLATYLPDDFSHRINIPPAIHPLGGERQGKTAALERLSQIFAQFETQRLNTSHLVIDGDKAALEVETVCLHRSTGAYLDTTKNHIWTLEGSWPTQLDEHYDLERSVAFMQLAT
jgi:SnoaL-like protein